MTFYTTIINAAFAVLIAVTFYVVRGGESDTFLLNLMFYIIITPIITVTLNKIMYASENQMIVEDALTRIDSILEKKPLTEAAGKADPKDMSITFENVSFRYEDAAKDALHNINLKIREGEHVAFVGPSGGGKSTLASLIARFFDATEGKIRIGGVDVRDIPSKQLMDMVSFVFQDSKLLKMSAAPSPHCPDQQMRSPHLRSGLAHFLTLPSQSKDAVLHRRTHKFPLLRSPYQYYPAIFR